jgi:hypothetical protein
LVNAPNVLLVLYQLDESTCRLAAVERETEPASPSALLIRHQKYDNHPDGQNENNVGEEVQHLSAGRFPVNQIHRKASWTENFLLSALELSTGPTP